MDAYNNVTTLQADPTFIFQSIIYIYKHNSRIKINTFKVLKMV